MILPENVHFQNNNVQVQRDIYYDYRKHDHTGKIILIDFVFYQHQYSQIIHYAHHSHIDIPHSMICLNDFKPFVSTRNVSSPKTNWFS